MIADVPAEVARVEGLLRAAMARAVAGGAVLARQPEWIEPAIGDAACSVCVIGARAIETDGSVYRVESSLGVEWGEVCWIANGWEREPAPSDSSDRRPWHDCGARLAAYAVEQGWLSP